MARPGRPRKKTSNFEEIKCKIEEETKKEPPNVMLVNAVPVHIVDDPNALYVLIPKGVVSAARQQTDDIVRNGIIRDVRCGGLAVNVTTRVGLSNLPPSTFEKYEVYAIGRRVNVVHSIDFVEVASSLPIPRVEE